MSIEEARRRAREKVLEHLRQKPPGSQVAFGTIKQLLSDLFGPNGTNYLLVQMAQEGLLECIYVGNEASVRLKTS